jgi:hypothetical protein
VEGVEVCDDGNTANGDGCSSTCSQAYCSSTVSWGPGSSCSALFQVPYGTLATQLFDNSGTYQGQAGYECGSAGQIWIYTSAPSFTPSVPTCVDTTPAAPTCSDGIQNQDETGVDCGGVCGACGSPPNFCPGGVQQYSSQSACEGGGTYDCSIYISLKNEGLWSICSDETAPGCSNYYCRGDPWPTYDCSSPNGYLGDQINSVNNMCVRTDGDWGDYDQYEECTISGWQDRTSECL